MKMEFWPPRATYSVHMLTLMPPPALPPRLREYICRVLSLVASLRELEGDLEGTRPQQNRLCESLMILLAEMAQRAEDPELGQLFGALSESLAGESQKSSMLAASWAAGPSPGEGDRYHQTIWEKV